MNLHESFEDIASPLNILLTSDLTVGTLHSLFIILHETYERLDQAVQKAAAVGLHFSPAYRERLTQHDTDKVLRQLTERNARRDADCRSHAEDVKKRVDRMERKIGDIEKAIEVKEENDRIERISFAPTLGKAGE